MIRPLLSSLANQTNEGDTVTTEFKIQVSQSRMEILEVPDNIWFKNSRSWELIEKSQQRSSHSRVFLSALSGTNLDSSLRCDFEFSEIALLTLMSKMIAK